MSTAQRLLPAVLLGACALALGWILHALFGAILWGMILALLLMPLHRQMQRRLGRHPNVAAGITLLVLLLIGVVPFALLTASLGQEASDIYRQIDAGQWRPVTLLQTQFERLPRWLLTLLRQLGISGSAELLLRADTMIAQGAQFIANQALGIGLTTVDFATSLCIALYLSFFFLRDGEQISQAVWQQLPLTTEQKQELARRFTSVVRATVKGSMVVAMIQGSLGGLAFYYLGIQGALLWAVLMIVASLIPVVGTAMVWLPVALYFLATGQGGKAGALVLYGVLVIGLIDNLLRPVLVGRDARLPDYVVMITTLGGMTVFGINGFVIGPVMAAMFIAIWHLWATPRSSDAQTHKTQA